MQGFPSSNDVPGRGGKAYAKPDRKAVHELRRVIVVSSQ